MKNSLLIIFILLPVLCIAQSVVDQNIAWNTNRLIEISSGKISSDINRFVVYKNERIEWQDGRGSVKYLFDIKSIKGAWANINAVGELNYKIANTLQSGSVIIKKTKSDTSIHIILAEDNKQPSFFEFNVATNQIIP